MLSFREVCIGSTYVRAIKSFSQAELQARKLKHPQTETDSLLLGVLMKV
ncbi:hypothetical protein LINPERPRIM_LOCUS27877 [Linum perenne]